MTPDGPVGEPVRVTSVADYDGRFGDGVGVRDSMRRAVRAFFDNGGRTAYVGRVHARRGESYPGGNDYGAFFAGAPDRLLDADMIVLPEQAWDAATGAGTAPHAVSAALAWCERHRHAMVLVDLPRDLRLDSAADVAALSLPDSPFAAIYYPWLRVVASAASLSGTEPAPPAAFVAGVWSRMAATRGIASTPAGADAFLRGTSGPTQDVDDTLTGDMNAVGINVIRHFTVRGTVLWGARTAATQSQPDWRYLHVRRLANFIVRSLERELQWTAFEPNDEPLWASLRQAAGAFVNQLYRDGAFAGRRADESYFVECGRGTTMTDAQIDAGHLRLRVGFAPLRPAEFVLVEIALKTGLSDPR